ncbi:MAG: hypothetical protein HYY64_02405 [Candidatus Rokubacteria bacterium]|nr:hypothetical protein [Candidatus Rokubacteria bacterium]
MNAVVVAALGVVTEDTLRRALEAEGWRVHAVGDCAGAGSIGDAIRAATELGGRL